MARNLHGTHSDLIHCDNCGEDYSSTYKRCPFCGARPANTQATSRLDFTGRIGAAAGGSRAASSRMSRGEQPAPRSRQSVEEDDFVFDGQDVFDDPEEDLDDGPAPFHYSGGRHLSGGGLGLSPTTLIGFVVSGVIVLAAILIVILVVIPMIKGGQTPAVSNSPNGSLPGTSASQSVSPSPSQSAPVDPNASQPVQPTDPALPTDPAAPTDSPLPSDSVSPSPSASVPPSGGSLTLVAYGNVRTDISISDAYPNPVQFEARGASGAVTWTSSNTAVATVSANGVVTGVGRGEAAVTATDAAGNTASCRVLVTLSNPSAPPASTSSAPSTSPAPSQSQAPAGGSLTFSAFGSEVDDFTMSSANPNPVTLRVNGASGAVTWSSSNTNVATVDANGRVSMVGKGQCRVTATDAAGNSASCIVRVN